MQQNQAMDEANVIKVIQRIIKRYDGIFDPTNDCDSFMLATDIVKSLKRHKLLLLEDGKRHLHTCCRDGKYSW